MTKMILYNHWPAHLAQLRVAMKSLGAPVLGDELYSNAHDARLQDRAYLHAAAIRLVLRCGCVVQAVLPPGPGQGLLFQSPAFTARLAQVLPREDEPGTWFREYPLLASELLQPRPPGSMDPDPDPGFGTAQPGSRVQIRSCPAAGSERLARAEEEAGRASAQNDLHGGLLTGSYDDEGYGMLPY